MLLDIHHKYLAVTPITFEDIDFSKFPFFIRLHIGILDRNEKRNKPPPRLRENFGRGRGGLIRV